MFPFSRKSVTQPKKSWDQAKSDYEKAILRCYKRKKITLALCGFQKFQAFNFKPSYEVEHIPFHEADARFYGVVHERGPHQKLIKCNVTIDSEQKSDKHIGGFNMSHIIIPKDETRIEEQTLNLDVILNGQNSILLQSLINGLRDAALSGHRFMHIELECSESKDEECDKVISDMRTRGFASTRNVLWVKMWPSIQLQNAPEWSLEEE
jgi:hypothetical protein